METANLLAGVSEDDDEYPFAGLEEDEDELEENETVLDDCQLARLRIIEHVYLSHRTFCSRAQPNSGRGIYSRAAFISLSVSNCAVSIRGRRLFEGGVYSRKYGMFLY